MNKLLLALLAMFLVLGLAYAQAEPTLCPNGTECAAWETCDDKETPSVCKATSCSATDTTDLCKGGFCRVEGEGETGACEAVATCEKYQRYEKSDNTCVKIVCDTTADCNATDKSTEGFCEGADADATPPVKGECVALCVQDVCEGTWEECSETTNTCADKTCENNTDDTCGDDGFCEKKANPGATDPYGVCIKNECTTTADCGADGFCKGATETVKGVCEAVVTCPTWQDVVDNKCVDRACDTTAQCNVDPNTGGFCEGADATADPAVKGKCVAACSQDDCVKGSSCSAETNQCTPAKCGETGDAACEAGSECVKKQCVPVKVEVQINRIGAKFSRARADGADAAYVALAKLFFDTLTANENCKPFNAEASPVAYAKNTIGYYVPATCNGDEKKKVEDKLNPVEPVEPFIALEDSEEITATVELKEDLGKFDESCTKPTFDCGTEVCNYPCGLTTACTEANADLVCGDYQKCVIADDAETGTCANSAAIYSTLVAIVLAVAAIVF